MRFLLLWIGANVNWAIWCWTKYKQPKCWWSNRLPPFSNNWLYGSIVDDIGWISRHFCDNFHYREMWTQENDGISIPRIRWLCYPARTYDWRVSINSNELHFFQMWLFNFVSISYFICLIRSAKKSNSIDYNTFPGTWSNRWTVSSGVCLYSRSLSNRVAIGWCWWLFCVGKIRCNGDAICCPSFTSNFFDKRRHCLWHIRCISLHSMSFVAVRDERCGYGNMNSFIICKQLCVY